MTTQTKHFVEIPDIVAVRLECKTCGGSLLVSLRRAITLPYTCPNCTIVWWDDPESLAQKAVETFMASIKRISPLMEKQGVAFSLEVNLPDDKRNL